MSVSSELPTFYIIGHSALVRSSSEPLPENTALLTYALCGEAVTKSSAIRTLEYAFFQKPRQFPRNVIREWRQFKETLGDDKVRIKLSPAKYHNQKTTLCSFWYVDRNNKITDSFNKAATLRLARSGIYRLLWTHGISRNVDIDIPIQVGEDAIVSRLQIGDIYAGAIFPSVEDLDILFGERQEMPFQSFYSLFRKLTTRKRLHTLKGILTTLGYGAYFLTSACRNLADVTKEEIDAMRHSSDEADTITQEVLTLIASEEKLGLGKRTKRKRTKQKRTKRNKRR